MKIAVSSYSFMQAIRAGMLTQEETLVKAKEMGFDGIEFIDLKPCDEPTWEQQMEMAARLREKAKEIGIEIVNYAIGANLYHEDEEAEQAELERIKKQVLVAKEMGCPLMRHDVCWALGNKCPSFDLMLPKIAKNVRIIADFAQQHGVRTCSENHGRIAQDSDRMERLFNAVNHPNYGLLIDMGNFNGVDDPHVTAVSRLAPYAFHLHAKDVIKYRTEQIAGEGTGFTRGGYQSRATIIGQGNVPVKQCLRIMRRIGYDGYVAVEFEGCEECIDAIAKGKANLERYLKEIELDFQ